MQVQEANLTATDHLFRILPWIEDNLKRIVGGVVMVLIAVFVFSFYSYRQNQRQVAAGLAFTQAIMSDGSERAAACLKVAADYAGTPAAQRALVNGATMLFMTGKYDDAQNEFQKFLNTYPDNFLTPQAMLGVAACLDALNKTDLAVGAYQKAAGQTANPNVVASAKFSLARINEAQGKLADAAKLFNEVARSYANTLLGSEAAMHAMELKSKLPVTPVNPVAASATNIQFNLSK